MLKSLQYISLIRKNRKFFSNLKKLQQKTTFKTYKCRQLDNPLLKKNKRIKFKKFKNNKNFIIINFKNRNNQHTDNYTILDDSSIVENNIQDKSIHDIDALDMVLGIVESEL